MMKRKTTTYGSGSGRFCRHLLEGVIEIPKRCLLNHECRRCGFDQWLEETGRAERRLPIVSATGCEARAD